jgi:predicted RNA binding protein YcfA (HicA-like mRNA interferase family)
VGELPQVPGARVLRALNRAGWELVRVQGSHHVLKHPAKPGLSLDEFKELL